MAMRDVKVMHQLGVHFWTLESYEFSDVQYIYMHPFLLLDDVYLTFN